jgi:hypothetical protein
VSEFFIAIEGTPQAPLVEHKLALIAGIGRESCF